MRLIRDTLCYMMWTGGKILIPSNSSSWVKAYLRVALQAIEQTEENYKKSKMKDKIINLIENLELKAKRHESAVEMFRNTNLVPLYNYHKGQLKALRYTIQCLKSDFL